MSSDVHGDIMYAQDIDKRIGELLLVYHNYARELDDYEIMELEALREFREAVVGQYGRAKWDAGMSFISDDYQPKYAAMMAEETYGEATNENAWNDEVWEEDFYGTDRNPGAQTFTLEDIEYWTDGRR